MTTTMPTPESESNLPVKAPAVFFVEGKRRVESDTAYRLYRVKRDRLGEPDDDGVIKYPDTLEGAILRTAAGAPGLQVFRVVEVVPDHRVLYGPVERADDGSLTMPETGLVLAENHWHRPRRRSRTQSAAAALRGERVAAKLCAGTLHDGDADLPSRWRQGGWGVSDDFMDTHYMRDFVTANASWALYTVEWLDSMARLLRGKRVLEVAAGYGPLGPLMRARGVDWVCTDSTPPERRFDWQPESPRMMDALTAQETIEHDVLFWSWWGYCDSTDYDLALRASLTGTPIIIVGESGGGCCGSGQFHGYSTGWDDDRGPLPEQDYGDDYDAEYIARKAKIDALVRPWRIIYPEGVEGLEWADVPVWDGIHDCTYFVLGSGQKLLGRTAKGYDDE